MDYSRLPIKKINKKMYVTNHAQIRLFTTKRNYKTTFTTLTIQLVDIAESD